MTLTIQSGQCFSSALRSGLSFPFIQSIQKPVKPERLSYNALLKFFNWHYGPLRFKPVREEPSPRITDFEIKSKEDVYKYADLINDILKDSELSSIASVEKVNGKMIVKISDPKKKTDGFLPTFTAFSLEFNEKYFRGEKETSTTITYGIEKNNNFYLSESSTFEHSNLSISRINFYIGAFLGLNEVRKAVSDLQNTVQKKEHNLTPLNGHRNGYKTK